MKTKNIRAYIKDMLLNKSVKENIPNKHNNANPSKTIAPIEQPIAVSSFSCKLLLFIKTIILPIHDILHKYINTL